MTSPEGRAENHVPEAPEPSGDESIDEVRADIAATRAELADTVDALSAKLDVKEQSKQKAIAAKDAVTDGATRAVETAKPYRVPLAAGAAAVAAVVLVVIVRRRRG